jgi:hypothetical protein
MGWARLIGVNRSVPSISGSRGSMMVRLLESGLDFSIASLRPDGFDSVAFKFEYPRDGYED